MSAETDTTPSSFAPYEPTSIPIRVFSAIRALIWVTLIIDNPLTWWWQQGRRNERADMEGPLYVLGAPSRALEPGKAVLATVEELKEFKPFLLQITIRSPDGNPLPKATIDFWHANTSGVYAYRSYGLRGRFTTDANGNADVLTVTPGDYGGRIGHFHLMMQDSERKCESLTTQVYVCRSNDATGMNSDFLNHLRKSRPQNMLHAWSLPARNNGEPLYDFPELSDDDLETLKRVEWWNAKLTEEAPGTGLEIVAGGRTEFVLNKKPGLLGF